ncbi:MAG TPA: serine/threonine-protein kinase [Pirellulaceae bacterium]|nr:serine/threonine-protein kinase [Pirellulaceae bacterium]HMP71450.1 serine/threonine-protein kinase [Pirellulaceae bacterium]
MKTDQCLSRQQIQQLLQDDQNQATPTIEMHLEHCANCRQRLSEEAAEPQWWEAVGGYLSSVSHLGNDSESTAWAHGRKPSKGDPVPQLVEQLLNPPSHPEMLGRIGSYDVERVLGRGGFGVVFKGHDTELNRAVAIKVLAPHLASSGVARRRFAREAQAAAAVSHPNVVPIHAVNAERESPYLVMAYVPGHSLQSMVDRYGPLDIKSSVRIAQQVAAGLDAAHRQGLVHRDIKPANILLENDLSRAMITDFGLARAADDVAATQTGWLAGTPLYMSPEQAAGRDIDARSDLFSLGSVLYFLTTGRQPFRGESPLAVLRLIGESQPLAPHLVNADIPTEFSRTIMRLLEKDPRDRFGSAALLSEHLEQYLAHLQHPQTCPEPRVGWSRRKRQQVMRRWLAGIVAASVLTVGGWSAFLWQNPERQPNEIAEPETSLPLNNPTVVSLSGAMEMLREEQAFAEELIRLEQSVLDAELRSRPVPQIEANPSSVQFEREVQALQRLLGEIESQQF